MLARSRRPRIASAIVPTVALAAVTALLASPEGSILVTQGGHGAGSGRIGWTTVATTGRVQAHEAGGRYTSAWSVRRGEELQPLTVVRTGHGGRARLERAGDSIVIDPLTRLELGLETRSDESIVIHSTGTALYDVGDGTRRVVRVVTPSLVAGVAGTAVLVTVGHDYTAVSVRRGSVEVVSGGTGEVVEVTAGGALLRRDEDSEVKLYDLRADSARTPEVRLEARRLERLDGFRFDSER